MFYKNFPKFLDKILLSFSDNFNASKSLDELTRIIFKDEIEKGYDINKPDDNLRRLADEIFTYPKYLEYALDFLTQEGLIKYDKSKRSDEKSIEITSKGFFKIKTESYAVKIKNDKKNIKLQKSTFKVAIFSLIVSILSAIVSTCNNFSSEKNLQNTNIQNTIGNTNDEYRSKTTKDTEYIKKDSVK